MVNVIYVVLLLQYKDFLLYNAIFMVNMCKITTFIYFLINVQLFILIYKHNLYYVLYIIDKTRVYNS